MDPIVVTAYLTAALVVVTGFYAVFTYKIMEANRATVNAMREQVEAVSRPYVNISIAPNHNGVFYLRITNSGLTGAKNLTLTLDRDFFLLGRDRNLRDTVAFTKAIAYFAPGAEITFMLASGVQLLGAQYDESKTPRLFQVTASFSFANQTVTEISTVDSGPYADSLSWVPHFVHELKEIREQVKRVADHA